MNNTVMLNVNVVDIPVRVVSDVDFARAVVMVSNWQQERIGEPDENGFATHQFSGTGDRDGEWAVVSLRQRVTAGVSRVDGKAIARISRHAEVEWIDLFSFVDPTGERIVPAARMTEVA